MDIKNLISGTINNIVGKVKDVAESTDVKETVKDIYEQGSTMAKSYGTIAKLSVELLGDKDELKKLYTEIGRLYFEETETPDDFFAPIFEQAREVANRIKDKEALIAALKDTECSCEDEECTCEAADIEVEVCEFEEVVDATEAEACCCDAPVEEAPVVEEAPAAEEAPAEEVKE